jgi:hypothetical protein
MKSHKGGVLDIFEEGEEIVRGGGGGRIAPAEDSDDDRKYFKKKEDEVIVEEEPADLELKEIPSDIEEGFTGKDKKEIYRFIEESESEEDSDDSFFGKKNGENSEVDEDEDIDGMSEIEDLSEEKLLGQKRKAENNIQTTMEETLSNLLSKNKQMTYNQIVKEISRVHTQGEVNSKLLTLLARMCNKFEQGGEYYYFKGTSQS